jgi:hypothetical protein
MQGLGQDLQADQEVVSAPLLVDKCRYLAMHQWSGLPVVDEHEHLV